MKSLKLWSQMRSLARYYNVLAYDQSRVVLTHDDKEVYVNANRVKVAAADREYILTQGESNLIHSRQIKYILLSRTTWLYSGWLLADGPAAELRHHCDALQLRGDAQGEVCQVLAGGGRWHASPWREQGGGRPGGSHDYYHGRVQYSLSQVRLDSEENRGHYICRTFTLTDQVSIITNPLFQPNKVGSWILNEKTKCLKWNIKNW